MDNRRSERVATDLPAQIFRRGLPVAVGRIKFCSRHGLFIETDYQNVGPNDQLDLTVILRRNAGEMPKRYKLGTLVVRKAKKGHGLALETLADNDAFELRQLVQCASANSRRSTQGMTWAYRS
ncbi:PilZ domain-containing protein [Marinimicrobium alkaliphilum]|uniref:PilZ domain-containing protein n=1 Tax=Marinimicrobium alkaliphilum TaxID=2202654 RepID=UPI000DB96F73|nr:PilZ domain-containing protein [Marinimicrobium alkaliphilum]